MYRADTDTEQIIFAAVQEAKRAALEVLPEEYHATRKRTGSEFPVEWIDKLRELAEHVAPAKRALAEFEHARNDAWTYLVSEHVPEYLAKMFRSKYPKFQHISNEDLESEIIFRLPYFIERFEPGHSASFGTFAARGMTQHLAEWGANQGPVEVPQKASRTFQAGVSRVSIQDFEESTGSEFDQSYDPWPAVDAYLDGDIREEDL